MFAAQPIKTSYSDHGKIQDAILAGNAEDAHRQMLEHISGSSKDFLELLARIPGMMTPDHATPKGAAKRR